MTPEEKLRAKVQMLAIVHAADAGNLLSSHYATYEQMCFPHGVPPTQHKEQLKAFFAGATTVLSVLQTFEKVDLEVLGANEEERVQVFEAIMNSLMSECEAVMKGAINDDTPRIILPH